MGAPTKPSTSLKAKAGAVVLTIRRGLRRGFAIVQQSLFRAFKTPLGFVAVVAAVIAGYGDIVGPFADQMAPWLGPFASLARLAGSESMGLYQFALTAISIVLIFYSVRDWRRRQRRYDLRPSPAARDDLVNRLTAGDDELVFVNGANGAAVLNAAVGAELDKGHNAIVLQKDGYAVPDDLKFYAEIAERALGALTLNEGKLGLRTEIDSQFVADGRPAQLQKTSYLLDRCTNSLIVMDAYDRDREAVTWRGRHHFVTDDHRLIRLERAAASNQLGGSTLLLDSDWNICLTEQTSGSAESAGLLAPTGSGSFDLDRLTALHRQGRYPDFQSFCRAEIERELLEETGLKPAPGEMKTVLIGFGRMLYRGGKPEVFAVTGIRRGSLQFRVTDREKLWTAGHRLFSLRKDGAWQKLAVSETSTPLAANLHLLQRYLASPASRELLSFLGTGRPFSA